MENLRNLVHASIKESQEILKEVRFFSALFSHFVRGGLEGEGGRA